MGAALDDRINVDTARVRPEGAIGARLRPLWSAVGLLLVAAHLLAPAASMAVDDPLAAAWTPVAAATAWVAAAIAALGLCRRGPTLLGPICGALALVAALWLRPQSHAPEPPPAQDLPRPRALPPIQRLKVVGGPRLQRDGSALRVRWLASCALQPGGAPRCDRRDGDLELALPAAVAPPPIGSVLRVHGWVHPDATPRNPGFERAQQVMRARGLRGHLRAGHAASVAVERAGPGAATDIVDRVRLLLRRRLQAALPAEAAALANGLGLGDRSAIRPALLDGLRATGTSHVLAVSGTHVGVVVALVAAVLAFALGRLWPGALRRAPRDLWLALPLALCAWAYTALAGAPASACRAATMVSVGLLWRALLRRPRLDEAVGVAVATLVVVDPWALADLGLALSLAGVLGAVAGGKRVLALWRPSHRAGVAALGLFGASLGAFVGTAAPGLPVFGALPMAAPLANLVVVPLVSLWLLPVSLLAVGLAALPVHACTDAALEALGWALRLGALPLDAIAGVPMEAWPWLRPPPALASLVGLALAPCLWAATLPGPAVPAVQMTGSRGRFVARGIGTLGLALCLLTPMWPAPRAEAGGVDVWMFDVGHGDATLLRFDDGTTMLVDGGGEVGDDGRVGRRALLPALRALDVRQIDVMVLSHPHPDHENGLLAVVRELPVLTFWSNGQGSAGAEHRNLLAILRQRGTRMQIFGPDANRRFSIGSARVDVLWPSPPHAPWDRTLGANDNSLVVLVRTAGASLLLAGDVEGPAERTMLQERSLPSFVDVLKVPHHGSRTSSSVAWLQRLQPQLAMAGARPWGALPFPDPDVRDRYRELGIPLWATADGAIALRLRADGWSARQAGRWWLRRRSQSPAPIHASQAAADIRTPAIQPGGSYHMRTRWLPAGRAMARNKPSAMAISVGAPSIVAFQPGAIASRTTSTPGCASVASSSRERPPSWSTPIVSTPPAAAGADAAPLASPPPASALSRSTVPSARVPSASMAAARSGSTRVVRTTPMRGQAAGLRCRTRSPTWLERGQAANDRAVPRSSALCSRAATAARSSHGDGRRSCRFTR